MKKLNYINHFLMLEHFKILGKTDKAKRKTLTLRNAWSVSMVHLKTLLTSCHQYQDQILPTDGTTNNFCTSVFEAMFTLFN